MDLLLIYFYLLIFLHINSFAQVRKTKNIILPNQCGIRLHAFPKCHVQDRIGDLPFADHRKFPNNSIFFLETSCKGGLDARQACSVESAARAHPHREINVFFTGPVLRHCRSQGFLRAVLRNSNVKLYRIHMAEFSKKTPMEYWLSEKVWNAESTKSSFPVSLTSDVLRYLTLYKYSGIYLDLDIIVTKSFDLLPPKNWVGKEEANRLGTALLSFSSDKIGRRVANETLKILNQTFRPKARSYNGNVVLRDALKTICSTSQVTSMSGYTCRGFEVYPMKYFYPISYLDYNVFMTEHYHKYLRMFLKRAYAFHLWNELSKAEGIRNKTLYGRLARQFCPIVFAASNRPKDTSMRQMKIRRRKKMAKRVKKKRPIKCENVEDLDT